MPAERLEMRRVREILRYRFEQGLGHKSIAVRVGAAPSTVRETLRRAAIAELSWPLGDDVSDAVLEAALYKAAGTKTGHRRSPEPDWAQVHRELKRKHMTLQILWDEYISRYPEGYRYSRFCDLYRGWAMKLPVTMRQDHAAGDKLFVDYAGDTVTVVVDRLSGKTRQAHLFVAVLGASSLSYAQARWSETLPDWIECHILALEFFGGAPALLVPDNAKVAIIKACHFDPQVNRTYCGMAAHYGSAVRRGRDARGTRRKWKLRFVSSNVGCWAGCAIASSIVWPRSMRRLANCSMISMISAFCAVSAPPAANCSKSLIVRLCDRCLSNVMSLPNGVSGAPGWIITSRSSGYSVPYRFAREQVEARITANTIEIFHKGERIAAHRRSSGNGKHTTIPDHMPSAHRRFADWTIERIQREASAMGPDVALLCERILADRPHPEQGFRACLGIIRLNKSFGRDRVNAACGRALEIGARTYGSVRSILDNHLDRTAASNGAAPHEPIHHANIRGPRYYH